LALEGLSGFSQEAVTRKRGDMEKEIKVRLGVLWVLLNASTEYEHDSVAICKIMDSIEKFYPDAPQMWKKKFKILFNKKNVFEWDNGTEVLRNLKSTLNIRTGVKRGRGYAPDRDGF